MKLDFDFWMRRGTRVTSIWRSLRAGERMLRGRAYEEDMFVRSRLTLVPGVEFTSRVIGFALDEDKWTIRVSAHLADRRVRLLDAELAGRDSLKQYICEFDVLSAHGWLEGKPSRSLPEMAPDVGDEQIADILTQNSQMIDRLWEAFGRYGLEGFQKLTLSVMRHYSRTRASSPNISMVCAALVYGDKDLARWLFREYEQTRILHVSQGTDSFTRGPSGEIRADLVKLLEMLDLP